MFANFGTQTGTVAQRKAKTIAWLLASIQTALGEDMIDTGKVTYDVDTATGKSLTLAVSS